MIAFDKEETIAVARRIGTLDLSLVEAPDCCTVFQSKRPALRGRVHDCERIEADVDLEGLTRRCLEGIELWRPEAGPWHLERR